MYAFDQTRSTVPSEFYEDVATKRLIAWFIDIAVILMLSLPLILPLLLVGLLLIFPLFLIPTILAVTGFLYRWATISSRSATWGMRLMAIELRGADDQRLKGSTAFWHTLGTALSFAFPLVQAVSVLFMATGERGQGITDMVLGTTMLNRAA